MTFVNGYLLYYPLFQVTAKSRLLCVSLRLISTPDIFFCHIKYYKDLVSVIGLWFYKHLTVNVVFPALGIPYQTRSASVSEPKDMPKPTFKMCIPEMKLNW